jgi:N-acetylmuramoyl-L-alanine amidase
MAKQHVVQQGESLVTIAHANGFRTAKPIWEHEANAELRARRSDPNILRPGDVIAIPDKVERRESCRTCASHRFVLERLTRTLRIRVQDPGGDPLDFQAWELDAGGVLLGGETDETGLVEAEVPLEARSATLTVGGVRWELGLDELDPTENADDDGVAGAQGRLRNLGIDPGAIDSDAGPKTRESISMFQASHGLPITGELDAATLAKLHEVEGC